MDKANIQEKKFESSQKRHTNMMNSVKDDRKGQNTLNGDGVNS